MEPIDQEHDLIKRYLLGQLSGAEQDRLEERFMTHPEYREEVLIVEDELLEDYLDENLSPEDKGTFVDHWPSTPQQIHRLEVAKALNIYCANPQPAKTSEFERDIDGVPNVRSKNTGGLSFRKPVVYALAAVLLVVALVGIWALFSRLRQRDFGQELAHLNSQQGRTRTADLTVVLPPVSLRGGESPNVPPLDRSEIIELLLVLPPNEYKIYHVTLRSDTTSESYTINNLEATATSAGRAISFRVPSAFLTSGDYFLEVSGMTQEGKFESVADYNFRVPN